MVSAAPVTTRQPVREAHEVRLRHYGPGTGQFRQDVLEGLRRPQKEISCKYFYDERGSKLFEEICGLDEYYLTRAELEIMGDHGDEMSAALGPRCLLIEYGSGSGRKTRLLLELLEDSAAYVPIDISSRALARSADELSAAFPSLEVLPVCADYTAPFEIPAGRRTAARRVGYYPGSTIGNFSHRKARDFLSYIAGVVGLGGGLLIGVDLKKDRDVLEAAYDDARGITAGFNRNLLKRINEELGGAFPLDSFSHRAVYNESLGRVEMHLVSEADQTVPIDNEAVSFKSGETIHTESCYKYDLEEFRRLASGTGFEVQKVWTDRQRLFSVQYLTAV